MSYSDDEGDDGITRILFLGDADCGKSTFLSRVAAGPLAPTPVILRDQDQPFECEIRFGNKEWRFELYDTASPKPWKELKPDMVVLCFDISQRLSLINMQRYWIKQTILTFQHPVEFPILVLGLKRDLRSEADPNGIIYPQEAYRIAQEMRCEKYMECSAMSGELVREAWEDICRVAAATPKDEGWMTEMGKGGCDVM